MPTIDFPLIHEKPERRLGMSGTESALLRAAARAAAESNTFYGPPLWYRLKLAYRFAMTYVG